MSQIARCCSCDQRVRIPDVDATAWVRCPHCREEYQLEKLAHDLPPLLEVLGDRPLTIDSDPHNPALLALSDAKEEGPSLDTQRAGSTAAPIISVFSDPKATEPPERNPSSAADVRSPRTLHADRVKQSGKRGFHDFLKIVLGGIAGLALGQVILWWLPQPYQSDPLNLAQSIPRSLQFLVPPNLRGEPEAETPNPVNEELSPTSGASGPRTDGTQGKLAAIVPPTDLKYSLQTAIAETRAFNEHGSQRPKAGEIWYSGLKQLAFCVTNIESLNSVDAEVVLEMTRFLQSLMQDREKILSIVTQTEKQLLADPLRNRDGVVIAGTVKSIAPAGELFRSTVRLAGSRRPREVVHVISRVDPKEFFQANDAVLILGVLITEPSVDLRGYKGPNEPVVYGGFPVLKPSPAGQKSPK